MIYSKFTLKNFRSFSSEQTLIFARPEVKKNGSGLTYIVGANNSGKTTIIEALWIKKDNYLNETERQKESPEFKLYSVDGDLAKTVRLLRPKAAVFTEEPLRANNEGLFEFVSSRRHWESKANGVISSQDLIAGTEIGGNPRTDQSIQTALFLKAIESDEERYNSFTALVKRVIPEFSSWSVGFEGQPYIKYESSSGVTHSTNFLGDGVISIIRILAHLFEARKTGLIIDEPELSLHPSAQKRLHRIIAEFSQNRQIILSTHSPYFISWEYIKNGARLNRVCKNDDTNSVIFSLYEAVKYDNLFNGANWQQPYLMDEVAKEIFFVDNNILFLEGQEDVGLLKTEFLDTDVHLFGYGVRGCENFKLALVLARDLGFQKVGILLDKGAREDELFKELADNFAEFKILQWNKSDIRDKTQKQVVNKEGYFSEKGVKKELILLDDFETKIIAMKSYFIT